ncbi:hypothetical protein [Thomasclavelia sp.]|uniref:hypothetical protein n=1 Tax=Thomasclavelia sp. TaxID=3025757 RepID=UPI0025FA5979|nr:hypothetical protein [Thomasclavelia sp.]
MDKIKFLICISLFIIGFVLLVVSKKKNYQQIYMYRTIAYVLFLSALFYMFNEYINIKKISNLLETLTTISATIAGFVFSGISIIFALLNVEYVNSLFKNNFLDKVFYKAYIVVILSLIDIALYVLINQFSMASYNILILFYLYIFWLSILLYMLMIFDFIKVIKRVKKKIK